MKLPKEFQYYLSKGIIRKSSKDKSRSEFLKRESEISLKGLKERIMVMGINDLNSNSIVKDCYDIVMEMIRAKLLLEGYSSSGSYAHEAEISSLKNLEFPESQISFLNELRYLRNSVTYYGKILDTEYAQKVFTFLKKIMPRLREITK